MQIGKLLILLIFTKKSRRINSRQKAINNFSHSWTTIPRILIGSRHWSMETMNIFTKVLFSHMQSYSLTILLSFWVNLLSASLNKCFSITMRDDKKIKVAHRIAISFLFLVELNLNYFSEDLNINIFKTTN